MVNLNYVVNLVRMDRNDFTTHDFQKTLQWIILGYRDLHFKYLKNVEVLRTRPNDAMIVNLPNDYEYYTKIGIVTTGGVFILSLNPDLPVDPKIDCGVPTQDIIESCTCSNPASYGVYPGGFWPTFRNGQYVGELYGRSGGVNPAGYFKIDEKRRQIRFSKIPKTELYIEYVSSAQNVNGSTLIPTGAVQTLRHYTHVQFSQHDDINKITIADKQQRIANYEIAKREFGLQQMPTLTDFIDAINSGFSPMKL